MAPNGPLIFMIFSLYWKTMTTTGLILLSSKTGDSFQVTGISICTSVFLSLLFPSMSQFVLWDRDHNCGNELVTVFDWDFLVFTFFCGFVDKV